MDPISQESFNADGPLQEELVAYLDGELDANDSRRIEQRAAVEPRARRMLEELDRTWHLLDELESPPTGDDFTRTTLEMVALAAADDARRQKAEGPRRRRRALLWTATGLVLAALAGFFTVAAVVPDPNSQLLADLPMLENYDQYREIDGVDFLRALRSEHLFATDAKATDAKITDAKAAEESAAPVAAPAASETLSQRRQRVEAMTADQREDLFHNEQLFRDLRSDEERRIRELHAAIENDADRTELLAVMDRYCQWFEQQTPVERGRLQRLKTTERIAEIKKQLAKPHLSGDEVPLDDKSRQALTRWIDRYAADHESHILEAVAQAREASWRQPGAQHPGGGNGEGAAASFAKLPAPAKRRMVREWLYKRWRSEDASHYPAVSEKEMAALLSSLSPDVRARLDHKNPAEQKQIIAGWLTEAISTEFDERLAEFFEHTLNDDQRDALMRLPSEQMNDELVNRFRASVMRQKPGEPHSSWDDRHWEPRPHGGHFGPRGSGHPHWGGGEMMGNRPRPDGEKPEPKGGDN